MKLLMLVHGDKGGAGKSHVAQLTAAVLLAADHPVTFIDGDAKNPGLHRYFNCKHNPVQRINARTSDC